MKIQSQNEFDGPNHLTVLSQEWKWTNQYKEEMTLQVLLHQACTL